MRVTLLLFCWIQYIQAQFILNDVNMTDATFEACKYCDARADRAGSRATAGALREFMTRNHIGIVVDGGEVKVEETLPDENIDTGHSCKYTARARNIVASASMVPGTVQLSPLGVVYIDELKNSFAIADVQHEVKVDLRVTVWFGTKIIKCIRWGQKTCGTQGYSKGINKISANFVASNTLVECIGGQEHLTFTVDVTVFDEAKDATYSPVKVDRRDDCDLDILDIKFGSINSKIQQYASRYVQKGDKFSELRGPKLVAELEKKLGAKMGSEVRIKINDEFGNPRLCPNRRKRASSCVRKTCPEGFARIGDTDNCQKFFGRTKPDCQKYGVEASIHEASLGGGNKLYWCHAPMVEDNKTGGIKTRPTQKG